MVGAHIELNEQFHRFPGGHPENSRRLKSSAGLIQSKLTSGELSQIPITSHSPDFSSRLHSQRYLKELERICRSGGGFLDSDTYVTSTSMQAAYAVVDATLSMVDAVMAGTVNSGFLLGRPPGHHAEHEHAMGFCLLNNVAIAAQYLIDEYKLARVAVIDIDVHHGNGTQHLFYDRSDVYFISTHQYPFYPGTGAPTETGTGQGRGFTLNIPMSAGDGDLEIVVAFEHQILPALHRYRPEFILVSAGFDAHQLDPLGGLNVTGEGFKRIARSIQSVAGEYADSRTVSLLEGGYDDAGNLDSISNYLEGLAQYG